MYGEIVTLRKGRNRHFALCCEKGAQNCCANASFFAGAPCAADCAALLLLPAPCANRPVSAPVVKLVDALDSKSSGEIRAGSSPARGTKSQRHERCSHSEMRRQAQERPATINGDPAVAVFVCRTTARLCRALASFPWPSSRPGGSAAGCALRAGPCTFEEG